MMTLPVLKEILRGIEGLWIRSFDDIVCIHTVKNKNGVVYYIYLNGGVEVEVECAQDQEREC
ncbi:MAG: hypothetical protein RMH84_07225, partial [Sulfolobales archaeon]|nr:hypothetical protein [Sulfolobales archaeon]